MTCSPLESKIHELYAQLRFIAIHQNNKDLREHIELAKKDVQNLLSELNQNMGLDIYPVSDQDPGLETMLSHDLGITLTPNTPD